VTASGWPFLIARGRRRGYTVLLAPGWLIAAQGHGVLEETVTPVAGQPWRVAVAGTTQGRRVGLAWAEHPVTGADVTGTPDSGGGAPVRDEHSRPLRLLYGFLCADAMIGDPSGDDLARSRDAALDTYRRFLTDEEHFTIEGSTPFDITSSLTRQPGHSGRAVGSATSAASPFASTPGSTWTSRWVLPAVGTLAVVLVGVGAIWIASSGDTPDPPCTPASTTAGPPAPAAPLGTTATQGTAGPSGTTALPGTTGPPATTGPSRTSAPAPSAPPGTAASAPAATTGAAGAAPPIQTAQENQAGLPPCP